MALPPAAPAELKSEAKRLFDSTQLSCREIGAQIGISGDTVQTWSRRGGWVREGQHKVKGIEKQAKARLAHRLNARIERKAEAIADRSAVIQSKMLDEGEKALETLRKAREILNERIDSGACEMEDVLKLTGALRNCVDVNRKLHGLDLEHQSVRQTLVQVAISTSNPATMLPIQVQSDDETGEMPHSQVVDVQSSRVD